MLSFLSFRDANILTPPLLSLEYLTFYLHKMILSLNRNLFATNTPFSLKLFSELCHVYPANSSMGYMIVYTEFCRNFVVRKAIEAEEDIVRT